MKMLLILCLGLAMGSVYALSCPANNTIQLSCQPGRTLNNDTENVDDYGELPEKLLELGIDDYGVGPEKTVELGYRSMNGTDYACYKTTVDQYFDNFIEFEFYLFYRVAGVYLNGYSNHGLDNVELYLGETTDRLAMYFVNLNRIPGDCTVVFDPPIHARYVKFRKRGNCTLELCDMTVYVINE